MGASIDFRKGLTQPLLLILTRITRYVVARLVGAREQQRYDSAERECVLQPVKPSVRRTVLSAEHRVQLDV